MKKELALIAVAFFLTSITTITGVSAIEEKFKTVTISTDEADVTGDGIPEKIVLKGIPYEKEEDFLKEIYIDIKTVDEKKYKIPLESGTKASLQLSDLNKDGVTDLYANVLTGGTSQTTVNYLFTLKDFNKKELTVPEPLEIASTFENGYKAKITISQTGETYVFNLKNRKKYYKKLGLYHKGRLNEPTELTVNTFQSLEPVAADSGEILLKGVQRITGISNADTIAFVESSWRYKDGNWNLIKSNVYREK